ncbi:hypothetical protein [Brachybacterium phenoliresistens]|uniref:hypothetical protein n=1 Tax=Brachybacterium phenoliresistens TaxID=396014 RepID=UPI0031D2AF45
MWANEDGIPLLGSPSHLNEYHTDPTYDNLVLSLASGAIGNSQMPVIDIYGGPLGWIPVFNPSHVKGHGTDYVTLLTSCGGVGIPLNSNDLTALNVDSVEQLADMSDLIMPGLPSPEMLTDPTYIWKTTDASDILARVTPETLLNMEEYAGFAGDHFDTWRLLWETALSDVSSGNPTGVLDVLKITDNIHTLESLSGPLGGVTESDLLGEGGVTDLLGEQGTTGLLGPDGVGGLLGEDATSGLLDGLPTDDLLGGDAAGGLLGGLLGGDSTGGLLGGAGGLLGGGGSDGDGDGDGDTIPGTTKFSSIADGSADGAGVAQCQGSLTGDVLSITCVYAQMPSEDTTVALNIGDDTLELESSGGTSGGAVGSFELTEDQKASLAAGDATLTVTSTGSTSSELTSSLAPC